MQVNIQKILIGIVLFVALSSCVSMAQAAAEQKVMLMFGGTYCDVYLGDVESALEKVADVKTVDLKSMKGHAIVMVENDKATPDQLVKAVNGVKGDGWHCSAQVMK